MTALIIVFAIGLLLMFWAVGASGRLTGLRTLVRNAFLQLDLHLKARHELVPNLVETVRGELKPERELLETLIAARNQAVTANARAAGDSTDAAAIEQLAVSESALDKSLDAMLVCAHANAELRSNAHLAQLREALAALQGQITYARQAHDVSVADFNAALAQFPGSIVARLFGLRKAARLQATDRPAPGHGAADPS